MVAVKLLAQLDLFSLPTQLSFATFFVGLINEQLHASTMPFGNEG